MFDIILFQPEIPPNTGNIIRLCANFGRQLHLIGPLGFKMDDRKLRRAGLDYHEWAQVEIHASLEDYKNTYKPQRVIAFTTKATRNLHEFTFSKGDALLFGPETRGLPMTILDRLPDELKLRIAMRPNSRSLNLSNAVAIACFEAGRQLGF